MLFRFCRGMLERSRKDNHKVCISRIFLDFSYTSSEISGETDYFHKFVYTRNKVCVKDRSLFVGQHLLGNVFYLFFKYTFRKGKV